MKEKDLNILFDHQIFSLQRVGGISRYFAEVMKNLPAQNCQAVLPEFFSNNIYLEKKKNLGLSFMPQKIRGRLIELLSRKNSKELLSSDGYDVFHPTYYSTYHLEKSKKPFVLTVHDMIHEIYPQQFRNSGEIQRNKKKLIQAADKIISISQHTKADILKFNDVDPQKIEVIYHGSSILDLTLEPLRLEAERFVLFVGDRKGYKNFRTLAEAFSGLNLQEDVLLFCVGGGPFSNDELQHLSELNIEKKTVQRGLTDGQLAWAYKNAACFVFPSLYEGFGIPILESMSFGTPTILAEASCFPEIAGDAAVYFKSTEELSEALQTILNSKTLINGIREKAIARSLMYSWEKVAVETSGVYKGLV